VSALTSEATPSGAPSNLLQGLDALLSELAARVADELVKRGAAGAVPHYATAKNNPIGSARAFLDAARARKFQSFKRGREVCAIWVDVEAWIESRKLAPRKRADPTDDDRALLDAVGIRPRAAGTSRR